jgi:hypothetical protein
MENRINRDSVHQIINDSLYDLYADRPLCLGMPLDIGNFHIANDQTAHALSISIESKIHQLLPDDKSSDNIFSEINLDSKMTLQQITQSIINTLTRLGLLREEATSETISVAA